MTTAWRTFSLVAGLAAAGFFAWVVESEAHIVVVLVVGGAIAVPAAVGFGASFATPTTPLRQFTAPMLVVFVYMVAASASAGWVQACPDCLSDGIQRRYWTNDLAIALSILFGISMASAIAGSVIGDVTKRLTRSVPSC